MATDDKGLIDLAYEAEEDLTEHQYRAVVRDGDKVRKPESADEKGYGILQNAPEEGEAAAVRRMGISKIELGGTVTAGSPINYEYNAATDCGKMVDCGTSLGLSMGICEEGGDEDELGSALIAFPTYVNVAS